MKFLSKVFLVLTLLVLLFMAFGWGFRRWWSQDTEALNVKDGSHSFEARRDDYGVWQIKAATPGDLAFAFGYVQAHDREFQTELSRLAATGRLASVFGEKQLKRDRLNRMSARVSEAEYAALAEDSPLREAIEAYIAGRRAFLKNPGTREPIEYSVLGLERSSLDAWEGWQLLAIVRLQSSLFAFDAADELNDETTRSLLGADLARLINPVDRDLAGPLSSLYGNASLPGLKSSLGGRSMTVGAPFLPAIAKTSALLSPESGRGLASRSPTAFGADFERFGFGDDRGLGASNAWLLANPDTGTEPLLCNDTHLGMSFPAGLYPVRYRVGELVGQGFMLPGLPALIVGRVDRDSGEAMHLLWGATAATFADTQDLVRLSPATLKAAHLQKESFRVRDPKSGEAKNVDFETAWTPFGPRVDEILNEVPPEYNQPLAMDWIGYRRVPTSLDFMLRRTLGGGNLREDLATRWAYPPLNFFWIEKKGAAAPHMGHAVTGLIYDRPRDKARAPIDEATARRRKVSQPAQRPYVDLEYKGREALFLANGNGRIFKGSLNDRLAEEWFDAAREERIRSHASELALRPEMAQTDFYSPALHGFVRSLRAEIAADRLCSSGESSYRRSCFDVLAALDRWDGYALEKRWEPTLAALWYVQMKAALWPASVDVTKSPAKELFLSWHRSAASLRALRQLLRPGPRRARWEELTQKNFLELAASTFGEALRLLTEGLGPISSGWSWGLVHHVDWQHPFAYLPPPLNTILRDGLLGPGPSLSGALDSPGRSEFKWNPADPLNFPAYHGAAARFCMALKDDGSQRMRWTGLTGVSGNPFSKWAWPFAAEGYFAGKLIDVPARPGRDVSTR